jgi:hypothetical protein
MRTLRVSAYSNDFTPLSGSGTLFELKMTRVSKAAQSTQLLWATPPDHFLFIDADLKTQKPGYSASGRVLFGEAQVKPSTPKTKPDTSSEPSDEAPDLNKERRSPDRRLLGAIWKAPILDESGMARPLPREA